MDFDEFENKHSKFDWGGNGELPLPKECFDKVRLLLEANQYGFQPHEFSPGEDWTSIALTWQLGGGLFAEIEVFADYDEIWIGGDSGRGGVKIFGCAGTLTPFTSPEA